MNVESERALLCVGGWKSSIKINNTEQMLPHLAFDAARSDCSYRSSVANHQTLATGHRSSASYVKDNIHTQTTTARLSNVWTFVVGRSYDNDFVVYVTHTHTHVARHYWYC